MRVDLPRPRAQGEAAFAALEKRILDRVLQKPADESQPRVANDLLAHTPAHALRWAV